MLNTSSVGPVTGEPGKPPDHRSPVFVLTASRSGSTLLRFILDSHPDLACPPETSIARTCANLVLNWSVLEGTRSPSAAGSEFLPPEAALAVRATIDQMLGRYLERRGKRRWCDKSLDTHQYAELMTRVYPDARFICLFRHCMDVIASGVEATPWGLSGFGYNNYAARHPGNSVAAIGSYWLDCANEIIAFMEKHPQACHQVRYEDLVTEPEGTAAAIFAFLGMDQVPGIAELAFRTAHEAGGPADQKIWFTAGVTSGSMGRGVRVPATSLPPPLSASINEALSKLEYRLIDDRWNATTTQADPRVRPSPADGGADVPAAAANGDEELAAAKRTLADRLESCDDEMRRAVSVRWPALAGTEVRLFVQPASGPGDELRITFGPHEGPCDGTDPADASAAPGVLGAAKADQGRVTTITADPVTWLDLSGGRTNLVTEIKTGRLRCFAPENPERNCRDVAHAVATLLGIAKIPILHGGAQGLRASIVGGG
jgi:hypothetical protein